MDELIDPNLPEKSMIHVVVGGKSGFDYLRIWNRLTDVEAIFNLLHLLPPSQRGCI